MKIKKIKKMIYQLIPLYLTVQVQLISKRKKNHKKVIETIIFQIKKINQMIIEKLIMSIVKLKLIAKKMSITTMQKMKIILIIAIAKLIIRI